MRDIIIRFFSNLVTRVGGPMTFRLIFQPLFAALIAFGAGLRDAREGRPPYFWSVIYNQESRVSLIKEGWKAILRIFVMAIAIDLIYQIITVRWFYPLEALVVAVVLAILPYLIVRGLVNRVMQLFRRKRVIAEAPKESLTPGNS